MYILLWTTQRAVSSFPLDFGSSALKKETSDKQLSSRSIFWLTKIGVSPKYIHTSTHRDLFISREFWTIWTHFWTSKYEIWNWVNFCKFVFRKVTKVIPAPAAKTETFLLPLRNLGAFETEPEPWVQKGYSNLSGRQKSPAAGGNFPLFLAAEGLIPFEKTHFPAQTPLQKRVFLKEINLSAAKNQKISRLRRGSCAAKNLRKNPLCR